MSLENEILNETRSDGSTSDGNDFWIIHTSSSFFKMGATQVQENV